MKSVITTLIISLFVLCSAFANDSHSNTDTPSDNCFFMDPDEKIVFIDFEEINGFAKQIIVKNERNEVVFAEQLWDKFELNGNIYEWNFSKELAGNFKVELHTFTKVLTLELQNDQFVSSQYVSK